MALSGRILITGGTGFLARGIYRRALRENWNAEFTCFSRDDGKHVGIERRFPNVRCIKGDVAADVAHLASSMRGHDTVIHAAAVKYVDRAEFAARETKRVNIDGSQNVMDAAIRAGVGMVVGISTDKACAPVNIYGMSKAVMERMFSEASIPGTSFRLVRYGNVVGSTGSVIPLFRDQLARTGKVSVTNPNMTRFWMGVDEAIDLIQIAAGDLTDGAIAVPYVKAMRLGDVILAAMGEVPTDIVGERAGEKRHEELVHFEESVRVRQHRDFFELMPVGNVQNVETFTLTSANPHHWMEQETMRALIADAETV